MTKYFAIVGAIALGALGMWFFGAKSPTTPPSQPPQPPLLSVEKMGHLVSVKVNYANVIEHTESITQGIPWTQRELRFGGTKVLLVARGDCLVGTDFRLAKYGEVNQASRSAVLLLPTPKLISARVNHGPREKGGSYFYAVTATGIEPIIPGTSSRTKAIDSVLAKAQKEVSSACGSADVLSTAKKNAEAVLLPAFSAIGWRVSVQWPR